MMRKKNIPKKFGWTLFIIKCADNTYFSGMTRNLKKEIAEIKMYHKGIYFSKHPERFPIKLVFEEKNVPFKEAYAKNLYLKEMKRYMKEQLIEHKKWTMGGPWKAYLEKNDILPI